LSASPFVENSYRNGGLCFGEGWSKKYFHFAASGECYGQLEESSTACPPVKGFQAVVFTVYFCDSEGFIFDLEVLTLPSPC